MNPEQRAAIVDPITAEVIRNKLEGIANEMELTLLKSSFSPIVKEGLDTSASLFTVKAETLAQACAIPVHLATLIPTIRSMIARFPLDTMKEGDAFILNDPYCGGTHLPDIAIMTPVFHRGRIIALSASMTHHGDIGGYSPGSLPPNSTEIYQEGLRIPPLRFREAGEYNETLVALLRQNSRLPDTLMGDLNAQLAACTVGARRLQELADVHGADLLMAVFDELLDRSEIMTREALRRIPEGTYRHVDEMDNDGIELDRRIRIEVAVTVKDGTIHFDLAGTSAQVKGPMNCVPSGSQAAAYYAVRVLTDPTIPTNGGCFRPVTLNLPKGSLANPVEPAPVNARTSTIKRIATSMVSALAEVLPDRVGAPAAGTLLVVAFGGNHADGRRYIVGELIAGGSGAASGLDGVDVIDTDASNCMNLPAEAMEMEAPIRLHRVALRRDSGGAGEFRGGLGVVREYEILADGVTFTHRGERHYSAAPGLAGGQAGASARSVIRRIDGSEEVIPSKALTVLNRGDRVIVETPGGGGYGDPLRRASVGEDIANGKVSERAAREAFGHAG
ncbi:MAG: hydantoinase B/oxoprolinase family protein [Rhodocyclaceae bacterium]|nr:hydantoinase B/oxoprolinase family protein [Rhodocyclaceae bacterium]MCA4903543.1 hydantoinase B/oxoprolinase family protein [Rhodocyclaceae bacterium]